METILDKIAKTIVITTLIGLVILIGWLVFDICINAGGFAVLLFVVGFTIVWLIFWAFERVMINRL